MDRGDGVDRTQEAENYKLRAEFILHELQANNQVYGSNSAWSGAQPADLDLALKYINRSLEIDPDNPGYLNLKALFLIEGDLDRAEGQRLMERAAKLAPDDITIQHNLEMTKKGSDCFIATAAFGTPFAQEIGLLRMWRDEQLSKSSAGRFLARLYYRISPPIALLVRRSGILRRLVRAALRPIIHLARQQR